MLKEDLLNIFVPDNRSIQISHVSKSTQQMEELGHGIVDVIQEIEAISKENASHTQTVSAATQEQTAVMQEFASSSQGLQHMVQELDAVVKRFKLDL